jgi:hypothetical protein
VTQHEHDLDQAVIHHNVGMAARSKGQPGTANIHFKARNRKFKSYVDNAPNDHLNNLDQQAVKKHYG